MIVLDAERKKRNHLFSQLDIVMFLVNAQKYNEICKQELLVDSMYRWWVCENGMQLTSMNFLGDRRWEGLKLLHMMN